MVKTWTYERGGDALRAWRGHVQEAVDWATLRHRLDPLVGPARAWAAVRLPRPANHYGTGRNSGRLRRSAPARPSRRGDYDVDKLARALLDGITAGGGWSDDSQVTDLWVTKWYGEPGALIRLAPDPERDLGPLNRPPGWE